MKIACYTDIHNQQVMLNYPTVLRKSAIIAADNTLTEFGKVDLSIIGGDNVSDYPSWNSSCALPYKNWLDIKKKIVDNFAKTAIGEKVFYVSGNNDPIMGDLPTAENPPYNAAEFYETGPMKNTLGVLESGEFYAKYAKSKGVQAGLYYLAFHYAIGGIDFFGLNIDPDEAFNSHDCSYDVDAIKWLKNKLNEVDPNGKKLIFVVGHVSATVRDVNGKIYNRDMDERRKKALVEAFLGHKNLFYLYGHVHGQSFLRRESWEGVLHFDKNGNVVHPQDGNLSDNEKQNVEFHTVHMGGLRPHLTRTKFEYFEEDGLTGVLPGDTQAQYYEGTGTPKIAQYLIIDTFEDKVMFSYRNVGSMEGFTAFEKPKPYIVELK